MHWLLTGYRVRVGNFSVIPAAVLSRLVVVSELWNHYSAAVFNARIEYTTIPTVRSPRLAGRTSMDFTALVVHGLSAAFGVQSDYRRPIAGRVAGASRGPVGWIGRGLRWPGIEEGKSSLWPLLILGLVLMLLLQTVIFGVAFVFLVLSGRQVASFIPLRDYQWFVERQVEVWRRSEQDRQAKTDPPQTEG